jgi:hypothetical protein
MASDWHSERITPVFSDRIECHQKTSFLDSISTEDKHSISTEDKALSITAALHVHAKPRLPGVGVPRQMAKAAKHQTYLHKLTGLIRGQNEFSEIKMKIG